MLDMSWGELMLIGGVALVVIPPKDLPKALRTLGQVTGKVRRMAGEFQAQFQDAIREAELDSVRKDLESINRNVTSATSTGFNPIETIRSELKGAVEGSGSAAAAVAPAALATPEIVPSSPEIAVSEEAAEQALAHGEAAELMPAEEAGAPPAIVSSPTEPHHAPAPPSVPMELTGPGLESMPAAEASGLGLTGGSRA